MHAIWALIVEWLQCPMKNPLLIHNTSVGAALPYSFGSPLRAIVPISLPDHRPPAFVQRLAFWGAPRGGLVCTAVPPELHVRAKI